MQRLPHWRATKAPLQSPHPELCALGFQTRPHLRKSNSNAYPSASLSPSPCADLPTGLTIHPAHDSPHSRPAEAQRFPPSNRVGERCKIPSSASLKRKGWRLCFRHKRRSQETDLPQKLRVKQPKHHRHCSVGASAFGVYFGIHVCCHEIFIVGRKVCVCVCVLLLKKDGKIKIKAFGFCWW